MNSLFKPTTMKYLLYLLATLLVIKLVWFAVEVIYLPPQGLDQPEEEGGGALYYRVKLTPNDAPPPQRVLAKAPVKRKSDIRNFKLLAIYNSPQETVITLFYKGKTSVLSRGELIEGYRLIGARHEYAIFSKNDNIYQVPLDIRSTSASRSSPPYSSSKQFSKKTGIKKEKVGDIVDVGDHKMIDRSLIAYYTKHFKAMAKNIGISESRNGSALDGFKINFIRKGSDFAKLGLKRGDVIKAVNGQALRSYKTAMDIYRKVNDMENMTLTIKRGDQEMELEYEIN